MNLSCSCCGKDETKPELHIALAELASLIKFNLTSGYRCLTKNRSIGSKDTSQHPAGTAADLWSPAGWFALLEAMLQIPYFRDGGIGVYPNNNFVHGDGRGKKARWVG